MLNNEMTSRAIMQQDIGDAAPVISFATTPTVGDGETHTVPSGMAAIAARAANRLGSVAAVPVSAMMYGSLAAGPQQPSLSASMLLSPLSSPVSLGICC